MNGIVLPALTGSEKQITWATDIRDQYLGQRAAQFQYALTLQVDGGLITQDDASRALDDFQGIINELTSAAWWIKFRAFHAMEGMISGLLARRNKPAASIYSSSGHLRVPAAGQE